MLQIEIEKLPSFVMGQKKEREENKRRFLEIAKELFIMNVSIEKIMEMTGLSRVELEQLKKED